MVETEPSKLNIFSNFSAKKAAGRFDDADLWGDAAEDVSLLISHLFLSPWMLLLTCPTKTFLMQLRSLSRKLGLSKTKSQESIKKQEPTRPESRKTKKKSNLLLDYLTSLLLLVKFSTLLTMKRIMDQDYLKTRTKKMLNLKNPPKLLSSRRVADRLSTYHHLV